MPDLTDIDVWRSIALGVAALGQTLFVALYATFPWWRSFVGRALFTKAIMLWLVTTFVFFARTFHLVGGLWDWCYVVVYGALAVGIWSQVGAFLRVRLGLDSDKGVGHD